MTYVTIADYEGAFSQDGGGDDGGSGCMWGPGGDDGYMGELGQDDGGGSDDGGDDSFSGETDTSNMTVTENNILDQQAPSPDTDGEDQPNSANNTTCPAGQTLVGTTCVTSSECPGDQTYNPITGTPGEQPVPDEVTGAQVALPSALKPRVA